MHQACTSWLCLTNHVFGCGTFDTVELNRSPNLEVPNTVELDQVFRLVKFDIPFVDMPADADGNQDASLWRKPSSMRARCCF